MRHADVWREGSAMIAKAASALLYDTVVWYLVWVCGVWVCVSWWNEQYDGLRKQVYTFFYLVFRLIDPVKKVQLFDWIPQS